MSELAVELRGVTKRFEGASRSAINQVDLDVAAGERFVIAGPSGSGKTTILRVVAGLESPSAGAIRLGGKSVSDVPPCDRGVAMVFQQPAIYPHLSVFENLAFGLRARRVRDAEVKSRVSEMAAWLGLSELLTRRPKTLSGGESQRVAIGRAAIIRPAVLLLDEPFSSLDAPLRASIRAILLDVHKHLGGTLILVTHDQNEAMAIGDRIALMRDGNIDAVGTPRSLYQQPPTRFVAGFLGDPPMTFLPCRVAGNRLEILPEHGWDQALAFDYRGDLSEGNCLVGLRPEAIDLRSKTPEEIALPGVVDRVELRGHESIVFIRVAGHILASRMNQKTHIESGTPISIYFDKNDIKLFNYNEE